MDNKNKILFSYLSYSVYLTTINVINKDFSNFVRIKSANGQDEIQLEQDEILQVFRYFSTDKKFIEYLYIHNNKYLVAVYDEELNYLNNIFLHNVQYSNIFYRFFLIILMLIILLTFLLYIFKLTNYIIMKRYIFLKI